jgi:hypothetical protein
MITLPDIVKEFAQGLKKADSQQPKPKYRNYEEGIGPFPEPKAIALIIQQLPFNVQTNVVYPDPGIRQKCDICIVSNANHYDWAIEVKLLRFLGDNGKPNDNMLTHILSPYPQHKSALNDCVRLARSSFGAKKAILIYGFEHDAWPLEPAIEAFEHLANKSLSPVRHQLGTRYVSCFTGLTHHIHKKGKVFGWELIPNNTGNHDTGRPLTPR